MEEYIKNILGKPVAIEENSISLLKLASICRNLRKEATTKIDDLEKTLVKCFKNTNLEEARYQYNRTYSGEDKINLDTDVRGFSDIWINGDSIKCDNNQAIIMEYAGRELMDFIVWHKDNYFFLTSKNEEKDKIISLGSGYLIAISAKRIKIFNTSNDVEIIFDFETEKFRNNCRNLIMFNLTNKRETELFSKISIPVDKLSNTIQNKVKDIPISIFSFESPTDEALSIFVPNMSFINDSNIKYDFEVDDINLENDIAISTYGVNAQAALTNIIEKLLKSTNSEALENCVKIINEMTSEISPQTKRFVLLRNNATLRGIIKRISFISDNFHIRGNNSNSSIINDNRLLKYKESCIDTAKSLYEELRTFTGENNTLIKVFIPLIESYIKKCEETIANNPNLPVDKIERLKRRICDFNTSIIIAHQCIATVKFGNSRRESNMFKQFDIYTKMIPAWGVLELYRRTLLSDYLTSEIDNAFKTVFVAYLEGNNELMSENMNRIESYLPSSVDTSILISSLQALIPGSENPIKGQNLVLD